MCHIYINDTYVYIMNMYRERQRGYFEKSPCRDRETKHAMSHVFRVTLCLPDLPVYWNTNCFQALVVDREPVVICWSLGWLVLLSVIILCCAQTQ